jgi:hypothetical protein
MAIGTFGRDTATLVGAATPTTGTVVYNLYNASTCTGNTPNGTLVFTNTQTLTANAIPPSASHRLLTAGSYQWQAVYASSNDQNTDATSPCGTETFTVPPNTPSLTTQAQSSPSNVTFTDLANGAKAPMGTFVRDGARLVGAATSTTGTVVYKLYDASTCTGKTPNGTVVFTNTQTLAANAIPPSASHHLLTAGNYQWQAVYTSGNGQNTDATSPCGTETFTVDPGAPTLATVVFDTATNAAWTGTETAGASAHDTATFTGVGEATPTGSVTYSFFANGACTDTAASTQTVTLSGGLVPKSNSTGALASGSYSFRASYSGDRNNLSAVSACEPFSVGAAPPPAPVAPITNVTVPVTG